MSFAAGIAVGCVATIVFLICAALIFFIRDDGKWW